MNLVRAVVLLASVSCSGGDKASPDAGISPDGGEAELACNPITQADCDQDEKCSHLVESEIPLLAQTTCVPTGSVEKGQACSRGTAGKETGFDNCEIGLACLHDACAEICDLGPPDTCRNEGDVVGEGSYCTLFADLFSSTTGLCVATCDPTDENACSEGLGCYINPTSGIAACTATPPAAVDLTQNKDCFGPASGGCFLNGCAAGFTPLLNNKPRNHDGVHCARYCSPANTYEGQAGLATGVNSDCGVVELTQRGGTNGVAGSHQCRFVQTFYSDTVQVPPNIGMCVPVTPQAGGTWGDCSIFDWTGIKQAWNGAIEAGDDPTIALDNHCLENPENPLLSPVKDICLGLFGGCISLEEENTGLIVPSTAYRSRGLWARSLGMDLPDLLDGSGIPAQHLP